MIYHLRYKLSCLKENWYKYEHMWNRVAVPTKTILLREGEKSQKAYSIEKECLRAGFDNNGIDVTVQFFFENEGVSSIESFRKNIPSLISIETIEPSILHWISRKNFETIVRENPELKDYLFGFIFERMENYVHHFITFLKYSPRERYINLLKEKPQIIQRVPQHYIASYLGITPVSLSRIRNKVFK